MRLECFDQALSIERQVNGAPNTRIVERLLARVDDDLVSAETRHPVGADRAASLCTFVPRFFRDIPRKVCLVGQHRCSPVRPGRDVDQLESVKVRQILIPVIGIADERPLLTVLVVLEHERTGTGCDQYFAQIVVVCFERFLCVNALTVVGKQQQEDGGWFAHRELHRLRIDCLDL